jgi:hypothetical protein
MALRENEEEMGRIRETVEGGRMKLLDYPWMEENLVGDLAATRPRLTILDNCLHQKEQATGAAGVARELGLDPYMDFKVGDAYEANFEEGSIDMLWCDFGVGKRMKEFMRANWSSLSPGGYLICHSTLTNSNTRSWLESVRSNSGLDACGIPAGSYEQISFLEPHKRFQNSVTIIQKRDSGYEEPLYSEYA